MKTNQFQFTSESVSEGHPDKVADQISDAILDAFLKQDLDSKVACECLITTGQLVIAGEVTSTAKVDVVNVAKNVIKDIGYTDEIYGFDVNKANYTNLIHQQSPEINSSVSYGGAGDQGIMFGYACDETEEFMPLAIWLAHRIMERQSELRKSRAIPWLLPDAKSQVTINYENNIPVRIDTIVVSTQHLPYIISSNNQGSGMQPHGHYSGAYYITNDIIRNRVIEEIIKPLIPENLISDKTKYLINPSGSFTIGGPHGDTGLTGRKIIVDTYGGSCPHGGGAFSGKDPSKVDRSAAYAARYVAKHIVASELAKKCTVQLSYAIGIAEPTSIYIDTHNTGKLEDYLIKEKIIQLFDLTPNGIIKTLNLKNPIYLQTAAYGHFGKPNLPWEQLDNSIINSLKSII
ncbi:MAG: methionine adenosyltransferase [Bacteroidota bacterium]